MALRAIKPSVIKKRLKVFFYGSAKVGKTTASIQFPKPYLIDTEKGAENTKYVRLLEGSDGSVFQTTDFDEVIKEITELLAVKHDYKTLIIDPLTTLYNDLLDKAAERVGTEFGRHYGEANKHMKQLMNLLVRLDMNVIITSHAKTMYGEGLAVIGQTFDCYKKLDYLFDLIIEVQKRGTDKRVGIVKGSRLEEFEEGEVFPFEYAEIERRYGKEILEKESVPELLASEEQLAELTRLIDLLKVPGDITDKWLKKAESANFTEMNTGVIQKCIDHLKKEIQGAA